VNAPVWVNPKGMLPKLVMLVLLVTVYLRSDLIVQLLPIQQSNVVALLAAPKKIEWRGY